MVLSLDIDSVGPRKFLWRLVRVPCELQPREVALLNPNEHLAFDLAIRRPHDGSHRDWSVLPDCCSSSSSRGVEVQKCHEATHDFRSFDLGNKLSSPRKGSLRKNEPEQGRLAWREISRPDTCHRPAW